MPWHHLPDGTFRNPQGSPTPGGTPAEWRSFFGGACWRADPRRRSPDGHVLPKPRAGRARAAAGADSITWLGHASFLIRLGRTAAHRPVPDASGLRRCRWFGPRRWPGRACAPERLPPIDVLLLSHNHYDHLDLRALARLRDSGRTTAVMPLRVARYLDRTASPARIELDWLEHAEIAGIRITALPGDPFQQAWPARPQRQPVVRLPPRGRRPLGPVHRRYRLWPGVRRGGAALPAPDLALVPIGAYEPRPLMRGSHCTPEEGVQIGRELGARRLCGMHWGTIRLTDEPAFEPPPRFRAAARVAGYAEEEVWILAIGETKSL